MPKRQDGSRPSKSVADHAHIVVKATLSAVPVAGGPLAELFAYLIEEPVSKRRDEWIEEIASRIKELEARLDRPIVEDLKNNASFTTVLLNANQIALRNHQREKIEALANAVINSALGMTPDDTERAIMLQQIDRLTPTHLSLLKLLHEPLANAAVAKGMANISTTGLQHMIGMGFPELRGRGELLKLVFRH